MKECITCHELKLDAELTRIDCEKLRSLIPVSEIDYWPRPLRENKTALICHDCYGKLERKHALGGQLGAARIK